MNLKVFVSLCLCACGETPWAEACVALTPVRWWAGCKEEEGPRDARWLGRALSQSTDLLTKPWPLWEGPGEVLLRWAPLSPPSSPSWPPALLTSLPDQTRRARGTATLSDLQICASFSLTSQDILVSPPKLGGLSAPPEPQNGIPTWKVSLFHF